MHAFTHRATGRELPYRQVQGVRQPVDLGKGDLRPRAELDAVEGRLGETGEFGEGPLAVSGPLALTADSPSHSYQIH